MGVAYVDAVPVAAHIGGTGDNAEPPAVKLVLGVSLSSDTQTAAGPSWGEQVKPFKQPNARKSIWQVVHTTAGMIAMWVLMYWSLDVGYWLTLLLGIPAGAMVVRSFIFSHDCGHGSFFRSRKANDAMGFFTGLLAYTPYLQWRSSHARHHKTSGQIEELGVGYFWTMTVEQYLAASPQKQLGYRLYRHPAILFTLGGFWCFLIDYRFADSRATPKARRQVYYYNLIYLVFFGALGYWLGYAEVAMVQLPMALIGTGVGLWLFHVQHHYEESYFAPRAEWSYEDAALKGSSWLKLGPIAEWMSGSINWHHVHHLAPGIPNYRLKEAHDALPMFQAVPPLTVREALKSYRYTMIDEKSRRWVGFEAVADLAANRTPEAPAAPAEVAPVVPAETAST